MTPILSRSFRTPRGTRCFLLFFELKRDRPPPIIPNKSSTLLLPPDSSGKSMNTSLAVSPEWPVMLYSINSASSAFISTPSPDPPSPPSTPSAPSPASTPAPVPSSTGRLGRASITSKEASNMRSRRRSCPLNRIILPDTSTTNCTRFLGIAPSSALGVSESVSVLSENPRLLNTSRSPDKPSTSLLSSRFPWDWFRSHTLSFPRLLMSLRISRSCVTCKAMFWRYCW
mmetsp:Transcript_95602/g.187682  ORF Transcript_95602/g.187682 Transcript_95602/m.187682 type:complete len:228 (-) Transcript_95602:1791-2474(-)